MYAAINILNGVTSHVLAVAAFHFSPCSCILVFTFYTFFKTSYAGSLKSQLVR